MITRGRAYVCLVALLGGGAAITVACSTSKSNNSSTTSKDAGPGPIDAGLMPIDGSLATYTINGYDASPPPGVTRVAVHSEFVTQRVDTQQLMFAAGEMQISGEPFAEFFGGRNLNDYDRTYLPPNQYILNDGTSTPTPITDLFGFGTAVESYEYSKYHMNMVLQQSTAGLALAAGPLVVARTEATPLAKVQARVAELMQTAGTDLAGYAQIPAPPNNSTNYLGFAGVWPEFAPFKSFDPTMVPNSQVVKTCTFAGGYGGIPVVGSLVPEIECAYNSLHLPNRDAQVEKVFVPAVLGMAAWKASLWAIDFTGRLHDSGSNPVTQVRDQDRALVGTPKNLVVALDPGAAGGTYIGSTPLEGMWGFLMLAELDNQAAFVLSQLTTTDGQNLTGFPTILAADTYDYTSTLQWFPASTNLVEDGSIPYPLVQSMAIADATSRSEDLAALLLGNSMFFGMTDSRNAGLGQKIGLELAFDGAPFAADDGMPNGENTAHDRALAIIRVAFIDLDRMHSDKTLGVTTDTATVASGVATPSNTVTLSSLAHVEIALRQALLSVNAAITQYGAADPDPNTDTLGILNTIAIHPASAAANTTFSSQVRSLFTANATFVRDVMTKSDGSVVNGVTIANGVATAMPGAATLQSQTSAIRALTEAFLLTGDETFRTRARLVAQHLDTAFYSQAARMYRSTEGGADDIVMTPELFAWIESALRETHKTLHVESDPIIARPVLEDRIARAIKLYLNGWDDLNGDQSVDTTSECLTGRMQMGEQTLTGELGRDDNGDPTTDRDSDCVLEIDAAGVGSVMAGQVHFHSP